MLKARGKFGINVTVEGSAKDQMNKLVLGMETAVTDAVARTALDLKANWRGQVRSAFGQRLGNTITAQVYPVGGVSLNAAAEVYSTAPKIIEAHERGAAIRANGGIYIAVPTEAAGKGRLTPGEWQFKFGRKLIFVPPGGRRRNAMLVLEGGRFRKSGVAAINRRRRRSDGVQTGEAVIPIFILVRQVKLPKRLSLLSQVPAAQANLANRLRSSIGRKL